MTIWDILIPIASALVAGIICFILGITYRKNVAEKEISSAEEEAKRIVNEAIKSAESKKREALVEAKEEILKNRTEFENETKAARAEQQKTERRLTQKEENLDNKRDQLEKKEDLLNQKLKEADKVREELSHSQEREIALMEKLSSYTAEQAKQYLIDKMESEVHHDYAAKIREAQAHYNEESEKMAREMVSLAIQRIASDQVSENTVSVVPLPNDEMKGRIIGREGRNIRALETLTGCDLIIDDTPEAITLSCFDPVRREIARLSLEKLIADGRIHPSRIEDMYQKATKEVEQVMHQEAERAMFETGIHNIHPEIVKLLGRLHYRTSYGQNVLQHSIEVSHIAGLLASELGIDPTAAKRAGLLHDIGKAVDHEMEGTHVTIGVELAKKYHENDDIVHAIHAHHNDIEPKTIVAILVQAADAISAARPGARRENLENYIKRLEKLEEIANSFEGVDNSFAIQAGREVRIIVNPAKISDDEMVLLARNLSKKIEDEMDYPGQIKVNLIRETRVVDYAK